MEKGLQVVQYISAWVRAVARGLLCGGHHHEIGHAWLPQPEADVRGSFLTLMPHLTVTALVSTVRCPVCVQHGPAPFAVLCSLRYPLIEFIVTTPQPINDVHQSNLRSSRGRTSSNNLPRYSRTARCAPSIIISPACTEQEPGKKDGDVVERAAAFTPCGFCASSCCASTSALCSPTRRDT